jgi:hypothetical protein
LDTPFGRSHASHGLDTTLDLFGHSLDWVATHTPADIETVRLEAVVTTWDNGRAGQQQVFTSVDRSEAVP